MGDEGTGLEAERGRAAPVAFAFGAARRRQAAACRAWRLAAGQGTLPRLADVPAREVAWPLAWIDAEPGTWGPPGEPLPTALLHFVRANARAIVEAGAPLGFRGELALPGGGREACRGVLLPFAVGTGRVAVGVVHEAHAVAEVAPDADDVLLAVATALACAPRPSEAPAPWGDPRAAREADAPPPPTREDRIALARLWAALAAANPACRATALHAALDAVHALCRCGGEPARPLVAILFADGFEPAERAAFVRVVEAADRLGLGAGMLGPLLDRLPGGAAALARTAERDTADPGDRLVLEPLDARLLGTAAGQGGQPAEAGRIAA